MGKWVTGDCTNATDGLHAGEVENGNNKKTWSGRGRTIYSDKATTLMAQMPRVGIDE